MKFLKSLQILLNFYYQSEESGQLQIHRNIDFGAFFFHMHFNLNLNTHNKIKFLLGLS